MNVVNLVILLESAACALGQEVWEVVVAEAPVHDAVEVQVMGMGAGLSHAFTFFFSLLGTANCMC